ncbi:hypothetical protein D3C85_250550 [compost metagenome]
MRVSPVAASTATSTKCAPKVDCWNFLSRSPNSSTSSATSSPPAAASRSVAARPEASVTDPFANTAPSLANPSRCRMAVRSLSQAAYTPAVELLAPHWPPEPADTGNEESPSRTTTFASGTPSISAAVCAMTV